MNPQKTSDYPIVILVAIILFSGFLGWGVNAHKDISYNGTKYVLVSQTPAPSSSGLQVGTMNFLTINPTQMVTPTLSQPVTINCDEPPISLSEIKDQLKNMYNVTLLEDTSNASLGLTRAKTTFKAICLLGRSPVFKSAMLTPGKTPLAVFWNNNNWCFYNDATHVNTTNICRVNGVNADCVNIGDKTCPLLTESIHIGAIAHEAGHVLSWRRSDLFQKWCTEVFHGSGNGASCTSSAPHAIPTYSCLYDHGIGPFAGECWADMMGSYISYKNVRLNPGDPPAGSSITLLTDKGSVQDTLHTDFREFPTLYSNYYNWARDTIWGGVAF